MKIQVKYLFFALILIGLFNHPAWAFEKVRFINFSDMHLSLKGKNSMKMGKDSESIVKTCIQVANQTPGLDFVILTGDLLQDGEPYNLDMLRHYLDQLNMPYYVVLGNHDMSPAHAHDAPGPLFPGISKATVVWSFQGRGFRGPDYHWSLEPIPGLRLIGLDSTIPGTWGGEIPQKTLAWLDKELAQNPKQLTIPIAHHNFIEHTPDDFDKTQNFLVSNAAQVRQVFERHPQVQFVISGHHHLVSVKKNRGITYFSNPSTTTYPLMYTYYELSPERLDYESRWLPLPEAIKSEALQHLLADAWWRPSQAPLGPAGDKILLEQFLGEPQEQKGSLPLNRVR